MERKSPDMRLYIMSFSVSARLEDPDQEICQFRSALLPRESMRRLTADVVSNAE
jgi:hypothetical protein